ncbi:MAG TPA: glycosyltransferase [Vicinamibacterales bacterium]|nr:glycosyltransferase [Vicinamibacterales bacterium]
MRVLRVITRLNVGGPSIQAARLSTGLAGEGFDTLLLHGSVGDAEGDMSYLLPADGASGTTVRRIAPLRRSIAPWSDVRAFVAIARAMAEFRPDIVHTHMAKAGLLTRTATVLYNWTHPSRRARIVHTYHGHVLEGYFAWPVTKLFIGIERMLSRFTDRIVAVSPLVRDDLLTRYRIGSAGTFVVIPLGLDLDAFAAIDGRARAAARGALEIPAGAVVVTTVGRLTAIKNNALFLDMAQRLVTKCTDAVFVIAGDGELRAELERDAEARGLAGRVRFLGWRRDLDTIYAATDVFAITSANEGTPVALIEAMAAGVAGVATDVGGVRDVITDSSVGFVVPPGNAEALASAVESLIADADRRARIGAAARQSVMARFRFERLTADIARLYRQIR